MQAALPRRTLIITLPRATIFWESDDNTNIDFVNIFLMKNPSYMMIKLNLVQSHAT